MPDSDIAHLEWGCPEDLDGCLEEDWPRFHPPWWPNRPGRAAHGARQSRPGPVRRAYCNQWPTVGQSWRGNWLELASGQRIPADAPVVFGVDAEPGHQSAAIVAAALGPKARCCAR